MVSLEIPSGTWNPHNCLVVVNLREDFFFEDVKSLFDIIQAASFLYVKESKSLKQYATYKFWIFLILGWKE